MLEDGEIDEDDVVVSAVSEAEIKEENSFKRKSRESRQNKRKKHSKNGHKNGHAMHLETQNDSDENSNHSGHFENNKFNYQNGQNETSSNFNNKFSVSLHPPSLLGLPVQKPKSLMSTSGPTQQQQQTWQNNSAKQPKSLFDLFVTPAGSIGKNSMTDINKESNFVDPIITEKENSKPAKHNLNRQQQRFNELKRKSDDESTESGGLISIESIEKKMEKKRKYSELQKERLKKQESNPIVKPVREPIICKFFLEGRCQKGSECPFSHNTVPNKKMEPCKFYLNGFCAKNENCLYMHAEFPCKFFHRKSNNPNVKSGCIHGDQCRFSHEPITDPLMQEALTKHIIETSHNNNNNPDTSSNTTDIPSSTGSILGSPPRTLAPLPKSDPDLRPPSLMSLMSVSIPKTTIPADTKQSTSPTTQLYPSSPPSRIDPPNQRKKTLLATPTDIAPSLMNNSILPSVFGGTAVSHDVDERGAVPVIETNVIPLLITNATSNIESCDIDERSLSNQPVIIAPVNILASPATVVPITSALDHSKTEALKQELILKIMNSIAENDNGNGDAISQLPKQTLTELLVKLLNDKDNLLGADVIVNLLATFGGPTPIIATDDDERLHIGNRTHNDSLNESSCNLQIDLNASGKKRVKNGSRNDDYSDYEIDEYDHDDDDEDNGLVIEGTLGEEMEYKIFELDVSPSKLWIEPPVAAEEQQADQECDPRIKYYQDKSNSMNIYNYQQKLIQQHQEYLRQQEQQNTPTSPVCASISTSSISEQKSLASSTTNSASAETLITNPVLGGVATEQQQLTKAASKNRIVDPRLKRNQINNNSSPTRSISPTQEPNIKLNFNQNQSDLISIQTRQLAGSSLLSSLPDLQFPKEMKNTSVFNSTLGAPSQVQDTSTVKLSIEDYKRKLQKPSNTTSNTINTNSNSQLSNSITNSTMSILNSLASNNVGSTSSSNSSSLPMIPSYSVNLQAPQSLHELLRNFQSS